MRRMLKKILIRTEQKIFAVIHRAVSYTHLETYMIQEGSSCILRLKIGNIQKVNSIEKGISTILIEPLFINGIKKYFSNVRFDLVLYATPPITFAKVIKFIKKRDRAKSYLMLKDIFPQNSLDLGMLSEIGRAHV